jgi:REP element-mobilizing transposase RayT
MPRQTRKDLDGKYFHIMVQGIGKEHIFLTDDYKGYYLTSLKTAREKFPVGILAFCVMGNHAHILLRIKKHEHLSAFMRYANAEYARYYNRMNKRVGYVFRDRFKSEVIKNVKYLVYCLAYIQNNPVKASIVEKAEDYKFSSYINYLEKKGIVDFEEAAKHYDITPGNIKAIMNERTPLSWIEHYENKYEDEKEILKDMFKKHKIVSANSLLENKEALPDIVNNLRNRSGMSLRGIAGLLGLARETLRKSVLRS